jgi:hypothetical protein
LIKIYLQKTFSWLQIDVEAVCVLRICNYINIEYCNTFALVCVVRG